MLDVIYLLSGTGLIQMLGVFGAIAFVFLAKYLYLIIKLYVTRKKGLENTGIQDKPKEIDIDKKVSGNPQNPPPMG